MVFEAADGVGVEGVDRGAWNVMYLGVFLGCHPPGFLTFHIPSIG